MDRKTFREICRSRRLCWGTVIHEYLTPHTVRSFARAGYDWLWIDTEHSFPGYETVQEVIRTADDMGIVTLLRVTQDDYALIARALDLGVGGVIIPRVETPDQVSRAVDCAKYPPVGKRGFGIRPSVYGRLSMPMRERIEDQNDCRFLCIQLESPRAVENIEAMLDAGRGRIDAVFFGPADFQVSIGKPDVPDTPELDAAVRRVAEVCAARGVSNGVPVGTLTAARWWFERGFTLMTFSNDDSFLANTAAEARRALDELERDLTRPPRDTRG